MVGGLIKWMSFSHVWLCECIVHGILQARILEWLAFPFSRGSSQPRSLTLQVDSLPAESQGKPKSTGVGSLSLLQWIFPAQELNWGLLHCRQILYQLSYQESLSRLKSHTFIVGAISPFRSIFLFNIFMCCNVEWYVIWYIVWLDWSLYKYSVTLFVSCHF